MNILTPDQVYLRDYNKIYTGTNQEGGYEQPFLGFITDTVEINLKVDKSTYFHYPNTATQMYLSAADIIESGATYGTIPFYADKIFKKQANYKDSVEWGSALPVDTQKGTWLCSWLSGNNGSIPMWMDRWYFPGAIDTTLTMFVCSNSAVYDEPSKLTFDPGVWYRYDHIGDNANIQIVGMISGLQLHIDKWDEISLDETSNNNNATIYNYSESIDGAGVNPVDKPDDNSLALNGVNQYGSILHSQTYNGNQDIAYSVWVQSEDWQKQPSHHLLSNGLRGGWNLSVNTGFFTPYNVLVDTSGDIIFNNQTGNLYKDIKLPGVPSPVSIQVDQELYTWVLDNGVYEDQKHLYKIDYNGNIDNAVYFSSAIDLYDIAIDSNNDIWVSSNQILASAFNTSCNLISTSVVNDKKLIINSQNIVSAYDVKDACIFEDEYYWTVDNSGDVYYNNTLTLSSGNATNVQCTLSSVWILFDEDKVVRYDKHIDEITRDVTFTYGASTQIYDTVLNSYSGRNIFFTSELVNGLNKEYVWILQPSTDYLYKYDSNLNIIQKINATFKENGIKSNAVKGDASGYQWNRKYNYSNLQEFDTPQIEASVYLSTSVDSITSKKYTTIIPTTDLTKNQWHMFSVNMNTSDSKLELYTDTVIRATTTIPSGSVINYKYETPLTIGSNIGHITTLDSELNKVEKIYHLGGFDDLRIYSQTINISDIKHIYFTKHDFKDIVWNMPTGDQSYVEEIVKFFKFKMPGQKSQYYNIHLKGLEITDKNTRDLIESVIKDSIRKIAPLYTSLYNIIWE